MRTRARSGAAPQRRPVASPPRRRMRRRRQSRPSDSSSSERHSGGVEQIKAAPVHFDTNPRPHPHLGETREARDQRLATGVQVYERLTSQRLDDKHVGIADSLIDGTEPHVLRSDAELELALIGGKLDRDNEASDLNHPSFVPRPCPPSPSV